MLLFIFVYSDYHWMDGWMDGWIIMMFIFYNVFQEQKITSQNNVNS